VLGLVSVVRNCIPAGPHFTHNLRCAQWLRIRVNVFVACGLEVQPDRKITHTGALVNASAYQRSVGHIRRHSIGQLGFWLEIGRFMVNVKNRVSVTPIRSRYTDSLTCVVSSRDSLVGPLWRRRCLQILEIRM